MAATAQRDYYEVLGLARDADQKAIKDAFRKLALKYHPDRNKEPGAEERFKEIAEAYAVLSDPDKRAAYDRGGFPGVAGASAEDLFGGIDFEDIFRGVNFDFGFGEGGLFDRFFRRRAGPARGENLETELLIPLEKVVSGGEEVLRVKRPVTCDACRGTGAKDGRLRTCAACQGSGRLTRTQRSQRDKGSVTIQNITVCPDCQGRGRIADETCPECGGSGQSPQEETLTVVVPAGVEEGMALRVPGHGLPSREPGGVPGDLFVVVHTAPDRRFVRRGADLWHELAIGIADAALGAERELATLDGPVTVKIPPGTQPDTVLRLHGKGLPHFGGAQRGDLLVSIRLHVPTSLSAEARRLYEQLRDLDRRARH